MKKCIGECQLGYYSTTDFIVIYKARFSLIYIHIMVWCTLFFNDWIHFEFLHVSITVCGGSGMSHAMRASPKPFFRAPWRMGDPVVSRGNAGWTTSKSGHP